MFIPKSTDGVSLSGEKVKAPRLESQPMGYHSSAPNVCPICTPGAVKNLRPRRCALKGYLAYDWGQACSFPMFTAHVTQDSANWCFTIETTYDVRRGMNLYKRTEVSNTKHLVLSCAHWIQVNFSLFPPLKNKDFGPGSRVIVPLLGTLVILAKQRILFPPAVNSS